MTGWVNWVNEYPSPFSPFFIFFIFSPYGEKIKTQSLYMLKKHRTTPNGSILPEKRINSKIATGNKKTARLRKIERSYLTDR